MPSTSQFDKRFTLTNAANPSGSRRRELVVSGPLNEEARNSYVRVFVMIQQSNGARQIIAKGIGKWQGRGSEKWEAKVKFDETPAPGPALGAALSVQYPDDADAPVGFETYAWSEQIEFDAPR